jgi:hypothetical protein
VSNGTSSTLDKAANDAKQNMSSAPACSPTQACGSSPPAQTTLSPTKTSWISIELLDDDGKPVPGEAYQITVHDGTVVQGSLDDKAVLTLGRARFLFPIWTRMYGRQNDRCRALDRFTTYIQKLHAKRFCVEVSVAKRYCRIRRLYFQYCR